MPKLGRSTVGRSVWDLSWMSNDLPFFYEGTSGLIFLKTDSSRIPHVCSDHFPPWVPLLSPPFPSGPLLKKSLLYFLLFPLDPLNLIRAFYNE